jgi:hypothetical protein
MDGLFYFPIGGGGGGWARDCCMYEHFPDYKHQVARQRSE